MASTIQQILQQDHRSTYLPSTHHTHTYSNSYASRMIVVDIVNIILFFKDRPIYGVTCKFVWYICTQLIYSNTNNAFSTICKRTKYSGKCWWDRLTTISRTLSNKNDTTATVIPHTQHRMGINMLLEMYNVFIYCIAEMDTKHYSLFHCYWCILVYFLFSIL